MEASAPHREATAGIDEVYPPSTQHRRNWAATHRRRCSPSIDDSVSDLASLSLSDDAETETFTTPHAEKLCLHIHCDGRKEEFVRQLYQCLFDTIDPTGDVCNIINETSLPRGYGCNDSVPASFEHLGGTGNDTRGCAQEQNFVWQPPSEEIPSLAAVLFLRDQGPGEEGGAVSRILDKEPWRVHHSLCADNPSANKFYTAGPNDPLCAVRPIHCGKQHIRLVRFTNFDSWHDQIQFYKLILEQEPDIRKPDFCLFRVSTHPEYDVQFALKQVSKNRKCKSSSASALGFKVGQLGNLVPLLPNMCSPVSDTRWRTTDLEGNVVYLDIAKPSRDSDSGVSTSYPVHSTPYSKADKTKFRNRRKYKHRIKHGTSYKIISGLNSDSSDSVITDLDAFMKSVLQPLIEYSRDKTPSGSSDSGKGGSKTQSDKGEVSAEPSAKTTVKSVRFNQIVHYLSDCGYPSETEREEDDDSGVVLSTGEKTPSRSQTQAFSESLFTSQTGCSSTRVPRSSTQYDTDEESYFSEAGVDVDFGTSAASVQPAPSHTRPKEPPPYKPPPPHPNARKPPQIGFYIWGRTSTVLNFSELSGRREANWTLNTVTQVNLGQNPRAARFRIHAVCRSSVVVELIKFLPHLCWTVSAMDQNKICRVERYFFVENEDHFRESHAKAQMNAKTKGHKEINFWTRENNWCKETYKA